MSNYSYLTVVAIPESLANVGALIGKALDPDTGGDLSFDLIRSADSSNSVWVISATPCVPDFAAQTQAMVGNAQLLFGACSAAYAARWPALIPPTLEQCEAFVSAAQVWVGQRDIMAQAEQLDAVLAGFGMARIAVASDA